MTFIIRKKIAKKRGRNRHLSHHLHQCHWFSDSGYCPEGLCSQRLPRCHKYNIKVLGSAPEPTPCLSCLPPAFWVSILSTCAHSAQVMLLTPWHLHRLKTPNDLPLVGHPTFWSQTGKWDHRNQAAMGHQSISPPPPQENVWLRATLCRGRGGSGETNSTGIWAESTAIYWWETVCKSKSSLKTFEDVWQFQAPKAVVCSERTQEPLQTEQPKGHLPKSLLREQHEKSPM